MPGNLHPAQPSLVFPKGLSTAFEMRLFLDANINEFADGRSIHRALALNDRHSFRLTRRLTAMELDDLRGFYLANEYKIARGEAFYFYNPYETVPLFSYDETGDDPIGRYTVVWESPWTETIGMVRHDVEVVLREVV